MAGLNADKIVDTAYELLMQYGLQDVSMRRISAVLDVRPGALYYHVPNKQELLRLLAHRALGKLNRTGRAPAELMRGLREELLAMPDGGDLALIAYSLDPHLPPVEALRTGLMETGASTEQAEGLSAMLMRYALGSIVVEQNTSLFQVGVAEGASSTAGGDAGAADGAPQSGESADGRAQELTPEKLYAEGIDLLLRR